MNKFMSRGAGSAFGGKKLLFVFPIAVLLAAGCNSSQQATSQPPVQTPVVQNTTSTPTPAPTPSPSPSPIAAVGPMPAMTFKVVSSNMKVVNGAGTITSVLDLYANGNKAGTVTTTAYDTGSKVDFFAGNSQEVLFSVLLTGIGDFTAGNPDIYKLDLQNSTVTSLTQNNLASAIDWTSDLTNLAYTTMASTGDVVLHVKNTNTQADQTVNLPARWQGTQEFILGIKISPDQTKIAVAAGYGSNGPYPDGGAIYIINLSNSTVTTYKQDNSKPLQVNGWKNNTDIDWSYYK